MSSRQRPEGYEAALYYRPEAGPPKMQLNVSQVGENANWRLCMDSTMRPPSQTKVKKRRRARLCRSHRFVFRNIIFVLLRQVCWTAVAFMAN